MWFLFLLCFSCGNPPTKRVLDDSKEKSLLPPPPPPPPPIILEKNSKTKEPSMGEKISEELEHAHSKTDCMIEYLNKKDTEQIDVQQIDISYEEYCQ